MYRSSQYKDGSENRGQYPTEEEIVDPYLNDETVGVPQEDQGRHYDSNYYPSQEGQELEQRGRNLDDAMDQNPGELGAFNLEVTQSGRPSSFDPSDLSSPIPEIDKEGVPTGIDGGGLQLPTRLEFAGLGRNGSVYYKAGPPRRSGALRISNSRHRAQQIAEEREDENPSYPTDQIESGDHGQRDRPTPSQGRLDQQRASGATAYGGDRQPRENPSSMAHSPASQAARSEHYPSAPEILQPGVAQNPQAAQAVPGSGSMGRPISSSMSPGSQRGVRPLDHASSAPGSHVSPPLQERQATVPQGAPQRPPQPGLQPQKQDQTASMPNNRSRSPQRTPPQMQQRAPVTPDPTRNSRVQPYAPVPSPSHPPTDLPSSQARRSAVRLTEPSQSAPYGQQGSPPSQMAGPQYAQDPHQRAAQQQQQDRPPAMVPSQKDQHLGRKPLPQAGRPSQSGPARTQEPAVQRPPRSQDSYQQHGMQQQQQQQRQPPASRPQQGAPSAAPNERIPRPGGFQQPQRPVNGNSSTAPMINQRGSMQQAHQPPLQEMAASAPFSDPSSTARPQRDQQSNKPSTQAYGAVGPAMTPQQQQPPAEPYGRQQNLTRSPPPPPAAMSPSQRPSALTRPQDFISNEPVTDVQTPPSPNSTQPPAQVRAPLRSQPQKPPSPVPLTGESLISTLVQGRPVPRIDVQDPKHGSALMEGPYCILLPPQIPSTCRPLVPPALR